jgi:predicted ATPase/class 3 adenylate cyclase
MIRPMRADLPEGTVTFLFTDVEGSTRLLEELGAEEYSRALAEHRSVVRAASARFGGVEVDTQGDAFLVAFSAAPDAIGAARAIRDELAPGPISLRMGVHTGTPLVTDEGYVGADVHRAARIAAAAHGGQVLVSSTTAALVDAELRDLGEHRFKDFAGPERLFQVGDGDYGPLRTLYSVRLPVPATPFLGREREVEAVAQLLGRDEVNLLTLVGPGGTGKTRLALQAAAESSEWYPDGIWWVPLAPLADGGDLLSVVARTLGVNEQRSRALLETLAANLADRRSLVLLDNAEHLLPAAAREIAGLAAIPGMTLLVTSRERLRLQGEQVYPVPTLTDDEAVELFVSRARALDPAFEADEAVAELCSRLDNLPLALELAAARTALFSPELLLERLSQRLDLLKGGRDAEPRQQTLRATLEWSHDLLTEEEQRLFRSLSVFADCTYQAAEEVCGADPDTLQSLLDKSLIRRRESAPGTRYTMLETIREYAEERLEESGDATGMRARHASWCCELAERLVGVPSAWLAVEVGDFGADYDNVRSALGWAWRSGHAEYGLRLCAVLGYWIKEGLFRDAVGWLDAARPRIELGSPPVQLQALKAAGLIAFFLLADPEQADEQWQRALVVAKELGDDAEIEELEDRHMGVVWERGDLEQPARHFEQRVEHYRTTGNRDGEVRSLHLFGELLRDLGRYDEAEAVLVEADGIYLELGLDAGFLSNTHSRADLALDRGDLDAANRLYHDALAMAVDLGLERTVTYCLAGIASVLAERGEDDAAATIWGAVEAAEERLGFRMIPMERLRYERRLAGFEAAPAWTAGRGLTLEEAVAAIPQPYARETTDRV